MRQELIWVIVAVALGVALYFYLEEKVLCDFSITGRDFQICVEGP